MANLPVLRVDSSVVLPDNNQWRFRIEIKSETSNRIYVVAQNIAKKHWGCSCLAWITRRSCKHLTTLGLPGNEKPYEVKFVAE